MKISERIHKAVEKFTLFDDTFMTVVFDDNLECTEYVVSTILDKKLKVTESKAQNTIQNLKGRSIRLDVKAVDSKNHHYNIEVQREEKGAKPRRARYNGSLMDANFEDSGKYGEKLPETFVIFITKTDFWGKGEPLYVFERKFTTSKGETVDFNDGLHIIYVNGAYRGDDKIGDLMHDFSCENPEDMKSKVLRETTAKYKKTKEGEEKMCKIMEDLNKLAIKENNEELILKMLKKNTPIEDIADLFEMSVDKVRSIQQKSLVVA